MTNENENPEYEKVGEYVSIFQRGEKWYANFQVNGQQKRQSLKTTSKKEARRRALRIERDLVAGEFKLPKKPPTIEAVVSQYLAFLRGEDRAAKTLTKYKKVFERVVELADRLHRRNILGIDLSFMDAYRQTRAADENTPKTIYCESVIIRQLVNFALTRRLIVTDPLKGIKIPQPKPMRQPCWTPAEVEQILAASREPQREAFTVLADTGLRIGELQWLTWADVDVERNVLHVRPKAGWKPKTGDQRAVPMSPRVKGLLEGRSRQGEWVFTAAPSRRHPQGGGQVSERRLLQSLKLVLKKLGLPGHLHTFRHAFISRALASGTPESQVRAWVGHVDRDVIRLYTHIADRQSQEAMEKLSSSNGTQSKFNAPEVAHGPQDKEVENQEPAQTQHTADERVDGDAAK